MTNWDFDELDSLEARHPGPWPWRRPSILEAKTWQKILGVEKLDAVEVRKAYRSLALKYHPDKKGDQEIFKHIQLAYEALQRI